MSGIGRLRPLERTQYEPQNSGLQSDAPRKLYYWAVRLFGGGERISGDVEPGVEQVAVRLRGPLKPLS